jgi:hypothetical protein
MARERVPLPTGVVPASRNGTPGRGDLPGFGRSERRDALMTSRAMGDLIVRASGTLWKSEAA